MSKAVLGHQFINELADAMGIKENVTRLTIDASVKGVVVVNTEEIMRSEMAGEVIKVMKQYRLSEAQGHNT